MRYFIKNIPAVGWRVGDSVLGHWINPACYLGRYSTEDDCKQWIIKNT